MKQQANEAMRRTSTSLDRVSLQTQLIVRVDACHELVVQSDDFGARKMLAITTLELPQHTRRLHTRASRQKVDHFAVRPSSGIQVWHALMPHNFVGPTRHSGGSLSRFHVERLWESNAIITARSDQIPTHLAEP